MSRNRKFPSFFDIIPENWIFLFFAGRNRDIFSESLKCSRPLKAILNRIFSYYKNFFLSTTWMPKISLNIIIINNKTVEIVRNNENIRSVGMLLCKKYPRIYLYQFSFAGKQKSSEKSNFNIFPSTFLFWGDQTFHLYLFTSSSSFTV